MPIAIECIASALLIRNFADKSSQFCSRKLCIAIVYLSNASALNASLLCFGFCFSCWFVVFIYRHITHLIESVSKKKRIHFQQCLYSAKNLRIWDVFCLRDDCKIRHFCNCGSVHVIYSRYYLLSVKLDNEQKRRIRAGKKRSHSNRIVLNNEFVICD